MKLKRLGLPKIAAIFTAFLMVVVGLVLSRAPGEPEAAASLDKTATAGPEASTCVAEAEPGEPESAQVPSEAEHVVAVPDAVPRAASASLPRTAAAAGPSRPSKPLAPAAPRTLPPLPPPNWGTVSAPQQPIGPPPDVLWLSGVIGGEPRVAVLRRGKNRYVVSEGDVFEESYRVVQISSNSVTLQRRGRKQTLRVGQY